MRLMRWAALISSFILHTCAFALTLAWNSPDPALTNICYSVYAGTNGLTAGGFRAEASVQIFVGTNTTCTLLELVPGTWTFTATAWLEADESDCSNMITNRVTAFGPPRNLRIVSLRTVTVQHAVDLTNTNAWSDMGFFRVKIGP